MDIDVGGTKGQIQIYLLMNSFERAYIEFYKDSFAEQDFLQVSIWCMVWY